MKNDERGLDALLAAAFRLEYSDELTDEQVERILKLPIKLSKESEATLAKLDDDYVMNVLNDVSMKSDDTQDEIAIDAELEQDLYAMNRDADSKDIDEETRRKIEEARNKAIEEKRKRDGDNEDGSADKPNN